MLLALDVGNTNTTLGLYRLEGEEINASAPDGTRPDLAAHWRVTTHRTQTVDEYGVLFVKLFEGETNTRVLIILDMSGSMNYGSGEVKKSDYAKMLASCLTYFAYHQRDAVGLLTFDDAVRDHIPASRRTGQLHTLLHHIEHAVPAKGTEFKKPLHFLGEVLSRRGIVIFISDFYDEPANILAGLKILKAKGNDIAIETLEICHEGLEIE